MIISMVQCGDASTVPLCEDQYDITKEVLMITVHKATKKDDRSSQSRRRK